MSAHGIFPHELFSVFKTRLHEAGLASHDQDLLSKCFKNFFVGQFEWSPQAWDRFITAQNDVELSNTQSQLLRQFVSEHPADSIEIALPKFLLALEAHQCSSSTVRNYRSDIKQFFDFCRTSDLSEGLTKSQLEHFERSQAEKGLQASSIKRKISSVGQFSQWVAAKGLIKASKLAEIETEVAEQISEEEVIPEVKSEPPAETVQPAITNHQQPTTSPGPDPDQAEELIKRISKLSATVERRTRHMVLSYLTLAVLFLFFAGLSVFGYRQLFVNTPDSLAYPSAPVTPNRVLSFQGRLTNSAKTPITTATNVAFKLYDSGPSTSGGNLLWDSGTCSVTPDQDGIFSSGLGSDCGSPIGSNVFTENANVWLQVEVGAETLSPRQPIHTVAYALNSETLQGYPISATGAATVNTVVTMNAAGDIVLGEVSPEIKASSGTFVIEGQTLQLQTVNNGDIIFDADGTGGVVSRDYISAPGATLSATYAGGVPLTLRGGPSGTANITNWQNSSGSTLAYVDSSGNIFSTGTLNGTVVNGTTGINTGAGAGTQRIDNTGNLTNIGTTQFNSITYTWPGSQSSGYILQTNGSGTLSWADPAALAGASTHWNLANGAIFAKNSTVDLLVGGSSTTSAKFAFMNVNSGTPIASISANSGNNATYLTGNGTLATTNRQPLTIGNSSTYNTSGSILLNPNGTGRVGIGTTNPTAPFAVGSSVNGGLVTLRSSNTLTGTPTEGAPVIFISRLVDDGGASSNSTGSIQFGGSPVQLYRSNNDLQIQSYNAFVFHNTQFNTESMRLNSLGNLGIGTNNPTAPLHINKGYGANDAFTVNQLNSGNIFSASASGTTRLVLTNAGNLGIGTTSPGSTLTVQGNIRLNATGNSLLDFNGNNLIRNSAGTMSIGNAAINVASNFTVGSNASQSFVRGSTTDMFISGAGLVGIGTTAPTAPLHVNAGYANNDAFTVNQLNSGNIFTASASGTTRLVLTNAGRLGIGTTAPAGLFEVSDTAAFNAFFTNTSGARAFIQPGTSSTLMGNYSNHRLGLTVNGTEYMSIATGGNVGIGTTTPGAKLDVFGDIFAPTATFSANYAGGTALTAKGGPSGTANIFNIQDSSSNNLAFFGSAGDLTLNAQADLRLADADSSNYVALQAPSVVGSNLTYTLPGTVTNGYVLQTDGSGTLTWADPTSLAGAATYWTQGNGALYPKNSTVDFLVGGSASTSAKFAFMNVNSGTPTASIAGSVAGYGTYLTGDGVISTTLNRSLALNPNGGNVGIGTSNPTAKLSVVNSANTDALTLLSNTVQSNPIFRIFASNGTTEYTRFYPSVGDGPTAIAYTFNTASSLSNAAAKLVSFRNNTTDVSHIRADGGAYFAGNVGIGTTSPTAPLHVNAGYANNDALTINQLNSGNIFSASASGTTRMTLTNAGDLGLGTTTPLQKLEVKNGNIQINADTGVAGNFNLYKNGSAVARFGMDAPNSTAQISTFGSIDLFIAPASGRDVVFYGGGGVTELMRVDTSSGNIGIGSTVPGAKLDVRGDIFAPIATFSANYAGGKALIAKGGPSGTANIFSVQSNASADLAFFDSAGNLTLNSQNDLRLADSDSSNYIALQAPAVVGSNLTYTLPGTVTNGYILQTDGSGTTTWVDPYSFVSQSYWGQSNGTLYPYNSTVDLLIGGQASTSAKFAFLNVNSGTPTASISGSVAGYGLSMSGDGVISTTLNRSLGINPTGGRVGIGTTTPAQALDVKGVARFDNASGSYYSELSSNLLSFSRNDANYIVAQNASGSLIFRTGGSNNRINILSGGLVGINTDAPDARLDVLATSGEQLRLTYSDGSVYSGFTVNSGGDLTIGTTGGNILSSSALNIGGGVASAFNFFGTSVVGASTPDGLGDLYIEDELEVDGTTRFGNVTYTWPGADGSSGYVLATNGSGTLSWVANGAGGSGSVWEISNGALVPVNTTVDMLVGSTSTASAKFAILNVNSGTPTASVSAGAAGAAYLTADGTLATTAKQALRLGNSTTGNVEFFNVGTYFDSAGNLTLNGDLIVSGQDITSSGAINITPAAALTLNSTGLMTLDSSTDIYLDADGADIVMRDGGVNFATFTNTGTDLLLDIAGGQLVLGDTDVLNIGGITGATYNSISDSTTASFASTDDDLYIEDILEVGGSLYVGGKQIAANSLWQNTNNVFHPGYEFAGVADLAIGGTSTSSAKFQILGSSGTATSSGKLVLRGTTDPTIDILNGENFGIRTSPGGDVGLTERFTVLNTGNVGIGTTTPGDKLTVLDGNIRLQRSDTTGTQIGSYWGGSTVYGTTIASNISSATSYANGFGIRLGTNFGSTPTSGTYDQVRILDSFIPTSGTAVSNSLGIIPVINQTGGANGISRGIYINPTLTAAADWRSIEIANNSGYGIYQSGANATNYFAGNVGIGTTGPDAKLDSLSTTGEQLRLTYTDGSVYTGFTVNSSGNLTIDATGTFVALTDDLQVNGGDIGLAADTDLIQLATNALTVNGTGTFTSDLTLNTQSDLRLADADSSNWVAFQAPAVVGSNLTYTLPGTLTDGYVLQTDGSGVLSWVDPTTLTGATYWAQANGALYPMNSTVDLLIGGQASNSAKFAVLNVNSGTPTASVSAGTAGAAYITAAGNLATTSKQNLTLGGTTTGDIILDPNNNSRVAIGTTPLGRLTISGAAIGKANLIINETGDQDIITASASGVMRFRVANDGYVTAARFVDEANSNHFIDPAASQVALSVLGRSGLGMINPIHQLQVEAAIEGKALSVFNETGDQSILVASSSGTRVFEVGNDGDVIIGNITKPDVDVNLYGDLFQQEATNLTTLSNITDTFVYDTTNDTDLGAWTDNSTSRGLSWYTEAKDDDPDDACVLASDDRCGKSAFPKKAILVTTTDGLYIFDAKDNSLWMKFTQAGTYALGADSNNNPSSVYAMDGRIWVGVSGSSAIGLVELDFKSDVMSNYQAAGRRQGDKNIANRNTTVSYATTVPGDTIPAASLNIHDVHAARINGKTFIAMGTASNIVVANRSDAINYTYTSSHGSAYPTIWLTNRGELYGFSNSTKEVEKWNNVHTTLGDVINMPASQENWGLGGAPSLFTTLPAALSSTPDALYVDTSGSYNTFYIGTDQGLGQMMENGTTISRPISTWSTTGQGQLPVLLQTAGGTPIVKVGGSTYIYAIGGFNNSGTALSTVYKATIDSSGNIGAWSSTGQSQLPAARAFHRTVQATVGGTNYLYVVTGLNSGASVTATVYKATVDSNGDVGTWSTTGQGQHPISVAYTGAVTASTGDSHYIYTIGGLSFTYSSTVYKATIDSAGDIGSWSSTGQAPFPITVGYLPITAANVNGQTRLFTTGGFSGGAAITNTYAANINSQGDVQSWAATPALTAANYAGANVVVGRGDDQYLYHVGGYNTGGTALNNIDSAKIQPNTSLALSLGSGFLYGTQTGESPPTNRSVHSMATTTIGGSQYLYVLGGVISGNYVSTVYRATVDSNNGTLKRTTTGVTTELLYGDVRASWPLNASNSSADLEDFSGKGNTLTATNLDSSDAVSGIREDAYNFDGSTESLSCTDGSCGGTDKLDFETAQNFSISTWFKHNGAISTNPDYLVTKYALAGYKVYMNASGQICFGIDDDSTFTPDDFACSPNRYDDSQWHHVVAIKRATNEIKLLVDGAEVASDTALAATATLNNAGNFYIGVDSDGTSNEWDGDIDEVTITGDILPNDIIRKMYLSGRQTLNKRTVAVTAATAATATTIEDSAETWTPNEFVGSLVELTGGTGAGQTRRIVANTATTLTVSPAWSTTPDTSTDFAIRPLRLYGATDVVTSIGMENGPNNEQKYLYVGTSNGAGGGGVTTFKADSGLVTDLYHNDAGKTDEAGNAWTGTSSYDNITSLAIASDVVSIGSGGQYWFEQAAKSFTQVVDELRNKIDSLAKSTSGIQVASSRESNTTSKQGGNMVIRSGWGWQPTISTTYKVSYGVTFDDPPIVITNGIGVVSTMPKSLSECTTSSSYTAASSITTTDFNVFISNSNQCYSWIAIGTVSSTDNYSYAAGADLAEWYATPDDTLQAGEVVSVNRSGDISVVRSGQAYDPAAIGIIATQPSITLGPESGMTPGYKDRTASGSASVAVALAGRVPVKVSLENGEIKAGDALTTSSTPGVAMKATQAGPIIGKAMENFDGKSTILAVGAGDASISEFDILKEAETNPEVASLSAELSRARLKELDSGIGTIMAFVNTSYADPSKNYTAEGGNNSAGGTFALDSNGSLVGLGSFSPASFQSLIYPEVPLSIPDLASGSAELTGQIATMSATPSRQNLIDQSLVKLRNLGTLALQEITAVRASILGRFFASEIETPLLNADQITADNIDVAELEADTLLVKNLTASGSSTLLSDLLVGGDATISGDLTVDADASISGELTATSARLGTLETRLAQMEAIRAQTAEFVNATVSGTLYAGDIDGLSDKVAAALNEPSLLDKLLARPPVIPEADPTEVIEVVQPVITQPILATSSAQALRRPLADLEMNEADLILSGTAAYLDQYFEVNGSAYIADSLGVENQIVVGNGFRLTANTLEFTDNFAIQPNGQGKLSIFGELLTLTAEGEATVSGNFTANQIRAKDSLLANLLAPLDADKAVQLKVAGVSTTSGEMVDSRFEVVGQTDTPVATISASGDATFKGTAEIAGLRVASEDLRNQSGPTIQTSKTAGKAAIVAGQTELTLRSSLISPDTIVHLTPLSDTDNQQLFVKSVVLDDPQTSENEQAVVIGFKTPISTTVEFSWWFIN